MDKSFHMFAFFLFFLILKLYQDVFMSHFKLLKSHILWQNILTGYASLVFHAQVFSVIYCVKSSL